MSSVVCIESIGGPEVIGVGGIADLATSAAIGTAG